MEKVLIFGSEGQLGYDLTRVFNQGYNVVALSHKDADVTDHEAVSAIVEREKPDFVINATAYNKVEAAETEKDKAFSINKEAVGNMAKAAEAVGAVFVHVSSDYVFDGSKDFYTEDDIPKPLNSYGLSKLGGEELVKASSANYYLIRTSSVFGAKESGQKKNFVVQMVTKAREGQQLRVVSDQIMSPTFSYDLAVKIKELIEKPAPFGLYHITNQGSCSWYEFTVKILELMNLKAEIAPISAEESGTKVNRPKKSVLKNLRLEKEGLTVMSTWQDALQRYLKEKYQV